MERFFPILIAIAWIGYKLYSSQKKQQQKAATRLQNNSVNTQKETPKFNLESIFEEFLGDKTQAFAQKEETVPVYENTSYTNYKQYANIQKESQSLESESLEKSNSKSPSSIIPSKKETLKSSYDEVDEKKSIDFDLRKAFIYQTILTRPYS
ncbi:MAG: hypothetical protein WCH34_01210 [Bacteroidota bacterium]